MSIKKCIEEVIFTFFSFFYFFDFYIFNVSTKF